ncbi:hypothetical protein [Sphingosinicella microcystinivorans]|uniref:4-amino-4-deoxy-L-arabinose transferase-like glycosyltransferase n=1 Tax=Sphingosinicella microcystinivorans TaxID=335406 RepID=A0AAD1G0M9_SPHMI|nr:hypothetical protein [Sphingosinicella microcystinivorans]RKS90802.1 hypothetical protein DFR51_0343 [Sphingosinicella microcystinivorans]BBE33716.1 hypothetical protein SmB9_13740 [Sphingosinicella microcystinivorans]
MDTDRTRGFLVPLLIVWMLAALALTIVNRADIAALDLPDTDDAQRLMQVRDWLGGQAWGDIDQHRMNPPMGANMHWSRLVDLPIAGIIALTEPVFGRAAAERIAGTAVPILALLVTMGAAALAAFRLSGRQAAILAAVFIAASGQILSLFKPLRIDHHNWQIALMLCAVAALCDPRRRFSSGLLAGLATVGALVIGLEMLPHLVVAGAILVLGWCFQPALGRLLAGYGTALAVGSALAYPAFVPPARWWFAACDAFSPVYAAPLVFGGALAAILPQMDVLTTSARRGIAAALGFASVGIAVLVAFPHCAGGPMAMLDPAFLPVLARISEARSIMSYLGTEPETAIAFGLYPFIGIGCAFIMLRRADADNRFGWSLVFGLLATTTWLMFLQLRAATGPNALAAIAAAAVAAMLLPRARSIASTLPRIGATMLVLVGLTSALPMFAALAAKRMGGSGNAAPASAPVASCTASATLAPLNDVPKGIIADVFDMGPAILVHTPHSVIAGPYHRNAASIADSVRLWRADDEEARMIAARYGATYVLGCIGTNDLVAAKKEAPEGLWARLEGGEVPAWLEAMPMPKGSALRLYRIKG